jgi:hypothetical protein
LVFSTTRANRWGTVPPLADNRYAVQVDSLADGCLAGGLIC